MEHLWGELIGPAIEGKPLSSSYFVQAVFEVCRGLSRRAACSNLSPASKYFAWDADCPSASSFTDKLLLLGNLTLPKGNPLLSLR